ncbi:MAG: LolA family protein [bacterium]
MDYKNKLFVVFIIFFLSYGLGIGLSAEDTREHINGKERGKIIEGFTQWYNQLNSMRVSFKQITLNKTWGQERTAEGILLFKKPGLMYWEYTSPQQDIIVVNRENIWWYIPEDKQVIKSEPDSSEAITPLSLLGNELTIEKIFNILDLEKKGDDTYTFSLEPKKPHQSAKHVILEISSKKFSLSALEVIDSLGNSNRIEFSSIVPNVPIDDAKFIFTPSPETKVITQQID